MKKEIAPRETRNAQSRIQNCPGCGKALESLGHNGGGLDLRLVQCSCGYFGTETRGVLCQTANEAAAISADGFVSIEVSSANAITARDIPADGWFPFATFGDHPSPDRTYVQVFHRQQAEEMVKTWNSIAGKFGRLNKNLRHRLSAKFSVPIFEQHVDMDPHDWSELKPLAEATDIRITENALEVYAKWNSANMQNRGPGPLYPSALWWHEPPDSQRRVFPLLLESIALVPNPNITSVPAWTKNASAEAAEKNKTQNTMDKNILIALLASSGVSLGANPSDEQLRTAIETRLQTANSAIDRAKLTGALKIDANSTNDQIIEKAASVFTTANAAPDRKALIALVGANENATNDQLTEAVRALQGKAGKVDGLTTSNGALADALLDGFEKAGKITAAQRAEWKPKFTANDANISTLVKEITEKKPEMNTKEIELNGNRIDISTANARQNAVQRLVQAEMKSTECDYNTAFDRVSQDPKNKQLFEAMVDPTKAKAA